VLIEQKPVLRSVKKGRKKVLSKNKEVFLLLPFHYPCSPKYGFSLFLSLYL
jgi:hypothetical protein